MGPKTTPSLISNGGYQIPPPPGREGNRHPLGNRVNKREFEKLPLKVQEMVANKYQEDGDVRFGCLY